MTPLLLFLEKAALFVVVLGFVVAFHELGHFLVAKAFGVKVDVFSVGFGRRILWRQWGETEYRLAVIPLGGYVLMAGDAGASEVVEGAEGAEALPRARHPRDFDAKPALARVAIMAAGPVFSALLAIILMWIAFVAGMEVDAYRFEPPRVGAVTAGSPAEAAGLVPGDLVLSAGGREVSNWDRLDEIVLMSPGARLDLVVDRGGRQLTVPVDVEKTGKHAIGAIGAAPCVRVIVTAVVKDSPAAAAGLKAGDALLRVGGLEPCSSADVVKAVNAFAGTPVAVEVERGGETLRLAVTPRRQADEGPWLIGTSLDAATTIHQFPPGRALVESWSYNVNTSRLVVEAIGKLLTGKLSIRAMSGPLEMASILEKTAALGIVSLLSFIALITLNLAIFNLLPIPILDGGRILLLGIEAVRGRDLERRTKEWILQAGLAMILLLTVVVLVFDVIKNLEG